MRFQKLHQKTLIVLYLSALFLEACSFNSNFSQEEILIVLPKWPPDSVEEIYPEFVKWEISICHCDRETFFYSTDSSFTISVSKNEPFSVTALPITKAYKIIQQSNDENVLLPEKEIPFETAFFFPAGGIYPFFAAENEVHLIWENGFLAECMRIFFSNNQNNGKSCEELNEFVLKFNWKKAQNYIDEQLQKSIIEENQAVYNPWLIDSTRFLENLSNRKFYQSYLNMANCFDFFLNDINIDFPSNPYLLSRFVPENEFLYKKNKTALKKDYPNFFSDGKRYGVILKSNSGKIVSKEVIFMPIYHNRL